MKEANRPYAPRRRKQNPFKTAGGESLRGVGEGGVSREENNPASSTVITYIRVWINRARWLPILLVISWTGKVDLSLSLFPPENLASRDGFCRAVPRQSCDSPHSKDLIWCLPTGFLPISVGASGRGVGGRYQTAIPPPSSYSLGHTSPLGGLYPQCMRGGGRSVSGGGVQ